MLPKKTQIYSMTTRREQKKQKEKNVSRLSPSVQASANKYFFSLSSSSYTAQCDVRIYLLFCNVLMIIDLFIILYVCTLSANKRHLKSHEIYVYSYRNTRSWSEMKIKIRKEKVKQSAD